MVWFRRHCARESAEKTASASLKSARNGGVVVFDTYLSAHCRKWCVEGFPYCFKALSSSVEKNSSWMDEVTLSKSLLIVDTLIAIRAEAEGGDAEAEQLLEGDRLPRAVLDGHVGGE